VPGDLGAGGDPHVLTPGDVVEEAGEAASAARPADDAGMEADVHQPPTLLVELLERVEEVLVEAAAAKPPGSRNLKSLQSSVYGTTRCGCPSTSTQ